MFGAIFSSRYYQPVWLKQLATSTKTVEPCTSKAASETLKRFNVGFGWAVTVIAWAAMLAGFAKIFIITFPAFEGYNLPISIGMLILESDEHCRSENL